MRQSFALVAMITTWMIDDPDDEDDEGIIPFVKFLLFITTSECG